MKKIIDCLSRPSSSHLSMEDVCEVVRSLYNQGDTYELKTERGLYTLNDLEYSYGPDVISIIRITGEDGPGPLLKMMGTSGDSIIFNMLNEDQVKDLIRFLQRFLDTPSKTVQWEKE